MTTGFVRPCGCKGKGRHRDACPETTQTATPTTATPEAVTTTPLAETVEATQAISDDELESYGGDIAALESWSPKSGRPLATWRDYAPRGSVLPDLNPKGMLVYKHAPEKQFQFAYLDEDGSPYYRQCFMSMSRRGYKAATSDDFIIHPSLRGILVPDETHRLTLGASKGAVTVVMVQSAADYRRDREYILRDSNKIQRAAEERSDKLQQELRGGGLYGVTASTTIEDDFDAAQEFRR